MAEDAGRSERRGWHVASWPWLAWLETVIKLAALAVALAALVRALGGGALELPDGVNLARWVILIVLSLGLVSALFDRLQDRELVAMAFVVINNLGHWGMVVAMAVAPGPGWRLSAFCGLMLLGDLVKLVFIKVHNYRVRDLPQGVLYWLTGAYVVAYAVILTLGWWV